MQILSNVKNLTDIAVFDLFAMLGLSSLSEKEKATYLKNIEHLVARYYLQEVLGDRLKVAEMEQLLQMPLGSQQELEAFMSKASELVPNAADLYLQAACEVKARLVYDHYNNKLKTLEELSSKPTSDDRMSVIRAQIEVCRTNLGHVENGEWGDITAVADNINDQQ